MSLLNSNFFKASITRIFIIACSGLTVWIVLSAEQNDMAVQVTNYSYTTACCLLADLPFPQLQVSSRTNRTKSVSSQKASSLLLVGFGERQVEVEQTVSGCGWCFFIVPASIRFKQTNLLELNMKYPQFQTYN